MSSFVRSPGPPEPRDTFGMLCLDPECAGTYSTIHPDINTEYVACDTCGQHAKRWLTKREALNHTMSLTKEEPSEDIVL